MYGTIRFVLDVWERYLGGEIPWHFARGLRAARAHPCRRLGQRTVRLRVHRDRLRPDRGYPVAPVLPRLRRARPRARTRLHLLASRPAAAGPGQRRVPRLPRVRRGLRGDDRGAALRLGRRRPAAQLARQHLPAERAEPHRRAVRHRAAPHRQPLAHDGRRSRPCHARRGCSPSRNATPSVSR